MVEPVRDARGDEWGGPEVPEHPPGDDGADTTPSTIGSGSNPAGEPPVRLVSEPTIGSSTLRSAFDEAPTGMAVATLAGVVTHYNRALEALLQRPAGSLLGRAFFDLTHPDDLEAARAKCATIQAGGTRVVRHECRFLRPDGTVLWVLISTSRPAPVPGEPPHLVMHIEDIDDRKALEAELTRRALHDDLTGLPNRTLLLDRLAHALEQTRHEVPDASLLFLDLDGFKDVNDTYGHVAGDRVLQQFAGRLTALLRPEDTAARLGGDEFLVLCTHTTAEEATIVAERMRTATMEPFSLGEETVSLTVSVGVSTARASSDPAAPAAAALLHDADRHMYRLKQASRRTYD